MFYIIYSSCTANSALSNRRLAYYRGLSELGIETNVWFLLPDKSKHRIEHNYKHIHFKYCWDNIYINHRIFRYLSYFLYLVKVFFTIKKGDVVFSGGAYDVLRVLSLKKGVHFFYESTESPEVHPPLSRIFKHNLDKYILYCKKLEGLFVISTALREYYIEKGLSGDKVHIINMIVDGNRFKGIEKKSTERYIAYCGNGNNKKDRVDELIKIFYDISKIHQDVKLYLIGPTKQPYMDEKDNVELVKEFGLEERVVFTGEVDAAEIPKLLVNATVLTLDRPDTIQNRCGFSTKLGEYLMSGNPVVVTKTGDTGLFLKDHESALLVEPGDSEAFKQQIIWVLEHPKESQSIGEEGKKMALESFNYLKEVKKIMSYIGI